MLGDSLVRWAENRAQQRNQLNLQIPDINVIWDGHPSLRVQGLQAAIQHGILQGNKPSIIVVHVGGNNISSSNICQISQILKRAFVSNISQSHYCLDGHNPSFVMAEYTQHPCFCQSNGFKTKTREQKNETDPASVPIRQGNSPQHR